MSGIAGYWHLNQKPASPSRLGEMLDAIQHRGPHASGHQIKGPMALGNNLIAPGSLYRNPPLPLTDPRTGLIISADARIENADELADTLSLSLKDLSLDSVIRDAQLILAAYQKWGPDCPDKLLGPFVFAIADPAKHHLFLARDPFGIRPLVYFHNRKLFAFASEAKALLALPGVPKILNRVRVADYLVPWLECIDTTSTFFEEIFRLPPGSSLSITPDTDHPQPRQWFHLDPDKPELKLSSDQEYEEALMEQFEAAVGRSLTRPTSVASMLSGGLDSTSIAAVANDHLLKNGHSPLSTFSATSLGSTPDNETAAINAAMTHISVNAHSISPNELADLDIDTYSAITQSDDPFDFVISLIPTVFSAASRAGHGTLMSGVDGDICVGSSSRHLLYLIRSGRFPTVIRECFGLADHSGGGWRYTAHLLKFCLLTALAPRSTRRKHRLQKIAEQIEHSTISPDFAAEVQLPDRVGRIYDLSLPLPDFPSLRHRHAVLIQSAAITAAMERYDRSAHRFSIEPAHPFLDRRLVEFALSLPDNQRMRHGWSKWILRKAIGERIPEATRWRKEGENVNTFFAKSAFSNLTQDEQVPPISSLRLSPAYLDIAKLSTDPIDKLDETAFYEVRAATILELWLLAHFATA